MCCAVPASGLNAADLDPGSLLHAACSLLRDFSMSHFQVFVTTQLRKRFALQAPRISCLHQKRGQSLFVRWTKEKPIRSWRASHKSIICLDNNEAG
jgi:hypothetical protein